MKPNITPSLWVLNFAVGLLGIALTVLVFWFIYQSHVALGRGDEISLWPPSITPSKSKLQLFPNTIQGETIEETAKNVHELVNEFDRMKPEYENTRNSVEDDLELFPEAVEGDTFNQTVENVTQLFNDYEHLKKEMRSVEQIKGNFLYRITTFHNEALCYGNSLNFSYISSGQDTKNCKSKEYLAERFLGFLAEIDFYEGDTIGSPKTAKDTLTKYQESKSFGRTGWYSRDVLKWIVLDYLDKV